VGLLEELGGKVRGYCVNKTLLGSLVPWLWLSWVKVSWNSLSFFKS